MKQMIAPSIIVCCVISLSACSTGTGTAPGQSASSVTATSSSANPASGQSAQNSDVSLKELMTNPIPQECSVTSDTQDSHMTATIRFSHGKMRGDYNTTNAGKTVVAHVITQNNVAYTWMDGTSMGYELPMDNTIDSSSDNTTAPSGGQITGAGPDMNEKMAYHCNAWSGDPAAFALPAGINFVNMGTMGQNVPGAH